MEIEQIDNACCIYKSGTFRLLTDPWLTEGAFEGSWYHEHPLTIDWERILSVDALYISHLHPDHYDPVTLEKFRKDIPIVILERDSKTNFLQKKLTKLGFTNIIAIADGKSRALGPFTITMYEPFCDHPFDPSELGNFIDSAIVIEDKDTRVLNSNDNTPDLASAKTLRAKHGKFDYAQLKYQSVGPYPACFRNLSHDEKLQERERLLVRAEKAMNEVAAVLEAKAIPFAQNSKLAGKLFDKNLYVAVKFEKEIVNPPGVVYPYEKDSYPASDSYKQLVAKARANLWDKQVKYDWTPNLTVYIGVYEELFCFNLKSPGFKFVRDISRHELPYISFHMDDRLLYGILTRKYHWNNAEVGCHIEMNRNPNEWNSDLVNMMAFFHT